MDKTMDIEVTDAVLKELKEEMAEAKRKAEYQKLQQELKKIKEPNEFEGAMHMPDTEQVLRTPRKRYAAVDLIFSRLGSMFAVHPIIGNLIAIGPAFFFFVLYLPSIRSLRLWRLSQIFWPGDSALCCDTDY